MVNCLNFGNPEHPEVMWQLSEAVDGLSEALDGRSGMPCVGGNVSLYNESRGADIDPTPVIGLLGMVDPLDRPPPGSRLVDGGRLVLVGETVPGAVGVPVGRATGDTVAGAACRRLDTWPRPWPWPGWSASWSATRLVLGAHDVAQGGVALAAGGDGGAPPAWGSPRPGWPTTWHLFSESVGPGGAVRRSRAAGRWCSTCSRPPACPTAASASPAVTA